jgi:mono/diheme cytochrome c family protein
MRNHFASIAAVLLAIGCHEERRPQTVAALPPAPAAPVHTADQLGRGAYIAAIAGCTTCHTPMMPDGQLHDHSRELAGTKVDLPGGAVAYLPNISPDRETGIGSWTDAQIIAAIRMGVRPDGSRLAPFMPYPYYNRMTDQDAAALVAWMRAQPPIKNAVPRNQNSPLKPVDVAQPRGYVDRTDDPKAHGEYIVTLMHCDACHTPRQGPFANQTGAGGTPMGPGVIASNITSDPDTGIGTWGEQDVIDAVRTMKVPEGGDIRPPMANYKEAWSQLSDADAHAMAVFVKAIPPVKHDVKQDAAAGSVSRQP